MKSLVCLFLLGTFLTIPINGLCKGPSPPKTPVVYLELGCYLPLQIYENGAQNIAWRMETGKLPNGLDLDPLSGILSGHPVELQQTTARICADFEDVQGSSKSLCRDYQFIVQMPSDPKLTHGPMVGAVTESSGTIWFRVEPDAQVAVEYDTNVDFSHSSFSKTVVTMMENDYTGKVTISGLEPGNTYFYRLVVAGQPLTVSDRQTSFATFSTNAAQVKIVILADFKPPEERAPALASVSAMNPDVVLVIGDQDHKNPKTIHQMRSMYKKWRKKRPSGKRFRNHILYKYPVDRVWDDHDYGQNNSNKTFLHKHSAIQAHDEYWPGYLRPHPDRGLWHSFNIGDLVEFFVLDLRSQRDLQTYLDPRYIPDDQPGSNRAFLRDDTARSMLDGDASEGHPKGQKDWFKDSLAASTAVWKIIVSSVPWNPTVVKDDAWWDYRAEWEELNEFIEDNHISNVVVVSGDIHSGGAIDDGTNSRIAELSVPRVNRIKGTRTTCSLHSPKRSTSFGDWSHGISLDEKGGFGMITATQDWIELSAAGQDGSIRLESRIVAAE